MLNLVLRFSAIFWISKPLSGLKMSSLNRNISLFNFNFQFIHEMFLRKSGWDLKKKANSCREFLRELIGQDGSENSSSSILFSLVLIEPANSTVVCAPWDSPRGIRSQNGPPHSINIPLSSLA